MECRFSLCIAAIVKLTSAHKSVEVSSVSGTAIRNGQYPACSNLGVMHYCYRRQLTFQQIVVMALQ